MTAVTMPKNILKDVMRNLVRTPPFKFFQNFLEKLFFFITVGTFLCMIIFVLMFSHTSWPETHWPYWAFLAQISLPITYLSYIVTTLARIIPSFPIIFAPEKTLLEPAIDSLDEELDNVNLLAQGLEQPYLEYALDSMTLVLEHFRSRISLLIGVLDKIGLIPLGVAAYFSLIRL